VSNTLLAFARPLSVAPQAIGVDGLFDRALLLARNEVAAKDIRVQRGDAAGLPLVHADPDLLSQVLLGLLSNATAATPPGGRLQLEATAAADTVEIAVSDSGPGIPEDLRARVFEPFFTTRARGTGLGLAVARQIVEAHGGRIDVGDSALGGARFRVRLPAAMAAAATA
jgi:signal transduction histidine kinase